MKEFKENITEVSVYSERALIKRELDLKDIEGDINVIFKDIPHSIIRDSVKVSGLGNFSIIDNILTEFFLEQTQNEKLNKLTEEIYEISDNVEGLNKEKAVLNNISSFLTNLFTEKELESPDNTDYSKFNSESLKNVYSYIKSKRMNIIDFNLEIEKKLRELTGKITKIQNEMLLLKTSSQKALLNCVVKILKNNNKPGILSLSYLIPNASWYPIYDARLLYKDRRFELITYGIVKQQTGENWENVVLNLSTANPVVGAYLPDPEAWFIDIYLPPPPPLSMSGGFSKEREKMDTKTKKMAKKIDKEECECDEDTFCAEEPMPEVEILRAEIDIDKLTPAPQKDIYSTSNVSSSGINVTFTSSSNHFVPSDGSDKKVFISMDEFDVKYEYEIMPAVQESAYLKIIVKNIRDYPLLSGNAKVFRDFDYIGDSNINFVSPGDNISLYMGIDDNIKVKRELVNKFSAKKGFSGKDVAIEFQYKLTVQSYKETTESITVLEQIPISNNKEIEVKVTEYSQFGKEDYKGIMKLCFNINPKESKEFIYSYRVRYPEGKTISNLD